jgi:hypothetical protein
VNSRVSGDGGSTSWEGSSSSASGTGELGEQRGLALLLDALDFSTSTTAGSMRSGGGGAASFLRLVDDGLALLGDLAADAAVFQGLETVGGKQPDFSRPVPSSSDASTQLTPEKRLRPPAISASSSRVPPVKPRYWKTSAQLEADQAAGLRGRWPSSSEAHGLEPAAGQQHVTKPRTTTRMERSAPKRFCSRRNPTASPSRESHPPPGREPEQVEQQIGQPGAEAAAGVATRSTCTAWDQPGSAFE